MPQGHRLTRMADDETTPPTPDDAAPTPPRWEPPSQPDASGAFDVTPPDAPDAAQPADVAEPVDAIGPVPSADPTGVAAVVPQAEADGDYSGEILPSSAPSVTRTRVPKSAIMGVIVALVVAAGAVAVIKVGGPKPPADIAGVVPADALGFLRISVEPNGEQRDALRGLLGRLPAAKRTEVLRSFDRALASLLDSGEDFERDVKPWLGPQVGFSAFVMEDEPFFVATVGVRDEPSARAFLSKDRGSDDSVFEIVDGVAYVAEARDHITAFRAAAERGTLDTHAGFRKELAAAGGDGLAVLWLNGEQIGKHAGAIAGFFGGLSSVPGLDTSAGNAVFVLKAEAKGLAFVGHQSGGPDVKTKAGRPALLEGAPASVLGALSIFDMRGSFEQLQTQAGAAGNPLGALTAALAPLGLDLDRDVLAWLGGEVTFVATPLLEFGVVAQVTDEQAYRRTIDAVLNLLGPGLGGQVTRESNGATIVADDGVVAIRKTAGKVAIGFAGAPAGARSLAQRLLTGDADTLGDSAPYKAVIGASSAQTVFQAYVNLRALAPFLADAGGLAALEPFEAAALRVTLTDGGAQFRLMLTLN